MKTLKTLKENVTPWAEQLPRRLNAENRSTKAPLRVVGVRQTRHLKIKAMGLFEEGSKGARSRG